MSLLPGLHRMDDRADHRSKSFPCGSELGTLHCFMKWLLFPRDLGHACLFARSGFARRPMQSVVGRCECGVKKPFQWALERFFVSDQEVDVGPVKICAAFSSQVRMR
ncbi:MAG: hypothetical protein JWR14_1545 [Caballeronia sp.]|jgi:hypothetical protein|nr:hypothetical protein [Caballeronia sp.]